MKGRRRVPVFEIRRLAAAEVLERQKEFADLLDDAVTVGGTVGFLLPMSEDKLERYWGGVARDMEAGERELLAAIEHGKVIGALQIAYEKAESVRHRADLQKLIVHSSDHRRGVARALLVDALERMPALGLMMYTITTFKDGAAEALVRSLMFTRYGMMPHYGLTPDGKLHDASMHYISRPAVEE
jgi:acetyltransferase